MTSDAGGAYPRIGVKYCGGCNPFYERGAAVIKALAGFPGIAAHPIGEEDCATFDVILVVLGCGQSECFDYSPLQGKHGQIVFSCPEDSEKLIHFIDNWRINW